MILMLISGGAHTWNLEKDPACWPLEVIGQASTGTSTKETSSLLHHGLLDTCRRHKLSGPNQGQAGGRQWSELPRPLSVQQLSKFSLPQPVSASGQCNCALQTWAHVLLCMLLLPLLLSCHLHRSACTDCTSASTSTSSVEKVSPNRFIEEEEGNRRQPKSTSGNLDLCTWTCVIHLISHLTYLLPLGTRPSEPSQLTVWRHRHHHLLLPLIAPHCCTQHFHLPLSIYSPSCKV